MSEENLVNLTIDGIQVSVPESYTVLEAARKANIEIPTLCFLKEINEIGACRMCLVEIEGMRGLPTSCITKVAEGMVVHTHTEKVVKNIKDKTGIPGEIVIIGLIISIMTVKKSQKKR